MMQINRNLYPRDGYFFIEGTGVRINGDSWAGVIKRVQRYRERNGIAVGNVEQDVMTQACQRNPGLCTDENAAYSHEVSRASLKSRVLMWFAKNQQKPQGERPGFVSEQDFNNRVAVCSRCPRNMSLPEGCASCRAAVNDSRKNIIGGRPQNTNMHACEVLGEDLNSSAWLDLTRIENADLPGHCWRKRQS